MASTGSNSSVRDTESGPARAEIVVGLTSFNDGATIAPVVRAIQQGMAQRGGSGCVVVADAGSTDGTRETARDLIGPAEFIEVESRGGTELRELPYHGNPHRAAALKAIFQRARRLDARACAVVDVRRHHLDADIVDRLVGPVVEQEVDYVSPYVLRHVNEGAITRAIVYPVFRALFGVRIRQPLGTEFACSARLLAHLLEQDFWDLDHPSTGIDLWFAVAAACGEFRVCEAALASRGAAPRTQVPGLSRTLAQVVGALFTELENRAEVWQRVRDSVEVPIIGTMSDADDEGPPLNLEALRRSFRLGNRELREIWMQVLPPRTILELRKLAEAPADRFVFDDRVWATIIYDFGFGYSMRVMPRDHLLRSLTPLYSGWLASFARQMRRATIAEVEERVERLCLAFEAEKRYLISRWRWPDRLR